MGEDKKKKFISERIVGRDVTKDKIIKWILLAIVCGAVFGLVSAGVNHYAKKSIEKKEAESMEQALEENEEYASPEEISGDKSGKADDLENTQENKDLGADAIDDAEEEMKEDSDGINSTDENGQPLEKSGGAQDKNAGNAADNTGNKAGSSEAGDALDSANNKSAESDGNNNGNGNASEDTASGENGDLGEASENSEGIDRENIAKVLSENEEFNGFLNDKAAELSKSVANYIVSVQCISKDKTWFDDMIESTENYAGVIAEVNEGEILILTKNITTESGNELKVVFSDGSANQAVIKARSVSDGLSVVAVSTEGLGEDFIEKLSAVEFSKKDISCGDRVISVGAPLGVVNSVDYGYIGYLAKNLQGQDTLMDVVFADIEADAKKGTFLMDTDGKLAGIAIENEEALLEDIKSSVSAFEKISSLEETINSMLKGKTEVILGIRGVDVSFDMKYSNVPEGMYITDINKSYPAYNVGIKRGDIIVRLNGNEIKNVNDYISALKDAEPGKAVGITISRSSANEEYKEIEFSCIPRAR